MSSRIIIVDDAAFIRELLRHIVRKAGFEVVGEAANGEEAVVMALREKPDLILMDIVMPRKSGIQATKEILAQLPKTKVVACTTEGQESMVIKALEAGCCDCIIKPFQIEQVLKSINDSLGG